MNPILLCVLALLATTSVSFGAQTATTLSDILEQAAFQQDTANDPERAISLYRQVIESEKATREMTAQALYNSGLCYEKLKRGSEASQAFGAVVSQYKNVEPYYRLANTRLNPSFSPVLPRWQDGERLEYEVRAKNGDKLQNYFWTTTTKANRNGRAAWQMLNRSLGNNGLSMTIADEKNLRPLYSRADNPNIGHATATWTENSIVINRADQEKTTETRFEGVVFDSEQKNWLIRQIPMSVGTKIRTRLLPALVTEKSVPFEVEVTGEEQIQVPAGQFNAYKLTDGNGIVTFWIDKGPERYLLKVASPASSFQLKRISTVTPGASRKVASGTSSLALSIPDEWFDASKTGDRKYSGTRTISGKAESSLIKVPQEGIYILDDDAKVRLHIYISDIKPLQEFDNFDLSLAGRANDGTEQAQIRMKNYQERAGTKVDRVVASLPAISSIADYQERGEEWVHYPTTVMRDTQVIWIEFHTPKENFGEAKPTFDRILGTITL